MKRKTDPAEIRRRRRNARRLRKLNKTVRRELRRLFAREAEEASGDEEDSGPAEFGFKDAFSDLEPLDSKGNPYLKAVSTRGRLFKLCSDEYGDLSEKEQRRVRRRATLYYRIKSMQGLTK